jgi:hypothetical protein
MSHNKRSNQYSGLKDIAISIKFDMEELEELMDYREAVASRMGFVVVNLIRP